ncbi:MAG TPA: hypothetical protein VNP96_07785 [Solirubrobacterales bacterium]|nr:hypothetical protein [Solirubrobacterales bacterium]
MLLAACALPSAAPADPPTLNCRYLEVDPPGPSGNRLEVNGTGNVAIGRDGPLVTVSLTGSTGIRIEERIECARGVAEVTNLDQIVYRPPESPGQVLIDERGGRFEPGATDEIDVGDEIEISVLLPPRAGERNPRVNVLGTPGADFIGAGDLAAGRYGVNLNWGRDTEVKDSDLLIAASSGTRLQLAGGGGGDRLNAAGGKEFARPVSLPSFSMLGEDGNDLLLGGRHSDFLEGDEGDDTIYGRGGADNIYAGPGRDRALGAGGDDQIRGARVSEDDFEPDVYVGGSGDDYISARYGGRDSVLCGSGFDDVWVDPYDTWRRCDDVQIAKQPRRASASS